MSARGPIRKAIVTDKSQELIEVEGDLPPETDIPNGGAILIISKDQSYLTHGIHKFPAKFFPELPRYLIQKYSKRGETVLDPMCGSGTTVLEALLHQRRGIGIDIDPMARLITKVKTTPIPYDSLEHAKNILNTQIKRFDIASDYNPSIPEFHYRDNWFRSYVLRELGIIGQCIDKLQEHNQISHLVDIRDFFHVIMSSIIRDVSNADPHCTRTVIRKKVKKKILPGDTLEKFSQQLIHQIGEMNQLVNILSEFEHYPVNLPSTTAIDTGLDDDSIDLAVTSPPYINAVDYPRTHQLEMYWLGFLGDGPLSKLKRTYIGTETVYKYEYENVKQLGISKLDSLLERIYERDPRRSYIVFKFFNDMEQQLSEILRVLKPGGRYCITIGNNIIRGIPINSHDILTEIAKERVGFSIERRFFSRLIRHFIKIPRQERMPGEWVLIFRK